jgi:hypothetical protein
MPLMKSGSKKAFGKNMKAEMDAGKPQKQALAIAYSIKRKNQKAAGGMVDGYAKGGEVAGTHHSKATMMMKKPPMSMVQAIMAKRMAEGGMAEESMDSDEPMNLEMVDGLSPTNDFLSDAEQDESLDQTYPPDEYREVDGMGERGILEKVMMGMRKKHFGKKM